MTSTLEFQPGLAAERVDGELRRALLAEERARRQALLWFHDVMHRELYRELGYASLQIYAREALGFSDNRFWQFQRLAQDLDRLPALRKAVAADDIGWTKAQLVARIATPASIQRWLDRARAAGRRELAAEVREAREQAREQARRLTSSDLPGATSQPELDLAPELPGETTPLVEPGEPVARGLPGEPTAPTAPGEPTVPTASAGEPASSGLPRESGSSEPASSGGRAAADVPIQVGLTLSPLQLAQFEALLESVTRQRVVAPGSSRGEIILAALELLATQPRARTAGASRDGAATGARTTDSTVTGPGGPATGGAEAASPGAVDGAAADPVVVMPSPYSVVLYRCRDCQRAEVVTQGGRRAVSEAVTEAVVENARIHDEGRNRHPLSPARRTAILARDGHRCRAPGCGSARFLEVHHILPRELGGTNAAANLVTLCGRCHRFIHDRLKRGRPAPILQPAVAAGPDHALHDRREPEHVPGTSPRPP